MPRGRKHTPKKAYILQIVWGVLTLLFITAAGYGVHSVTRLPNLTIDTVVVSAGDTIDAEVVEAVVATELAGSYLALIPRTFTYLYPAAAITAAVEAIPRVKEATVARQDKNTIAVEFTEYKPRALWCNEGHTNCLLIDETGFAFADAPKLTGGSMLRFVVEDRPLLVRQTVLSASELMEAKLFAEQLEQEFGFNAEAFYYEQNGDITVKLAGGGELLMSRSESVEATFNNLETVLGSEDFLHLRPGNFQYIDLRFGNKVFVNEEIAVPEMSSSTATSS